MSFLFGGGSSGGSAPTKLAGMSIQSSSQGLPIPLVYGQTRVSGNLLWYGDFTAIKHTEKVGEGKASTTITTYTYTAGLIFGLCEGTQNSVGKIWSNKDISSLSGLELTFMAGDYTQTPWSYLTTNHPSEAFAYRGTAYVASGAFDLGSGNTVPNLSYELNPTAGDVNPKDVLVDFLIDQDYGVDWSYARLDSLDDFQQSCTANGIRVAPAYASQTAAADMATELALIGNSAIVWSEGVLKVIPYAGERMDSPLVIPVVGAEMTNIAATWTLPKAFSTPLLTIVGVPTVDVTLETSDFRYYISRILSLDPAVVGVAVTNAAVISTGGSTFPTYSLDSAVVAMACSTLNISLAPVSYGRNLDLDPSVIAVAVSTNTPTVDVESISKTLTLDSAVPGVSVATS